jgi:TPR repeat protein
MGPVRRAINLICALGLTGAGAYFFFDFLFYHPPRASHGGKFVALVIAGAATAAFLGLYWLWVDFINADPKPEASNSFTPVQQLQAEAERGNAQAQYILGGAYYNGNGVARNPAQGAQWLLKAAEGGFAPAQCDLGVMYQNGVGVDQSFDDAVKWYEKAAEQGDALACHNLGSIRAKGFWDKKLDSFQQMRFAYATSNNVEAYKWFTLAAKRGHALSLKDKSILERSMSPSQIEVAQRLAQAFEADVGVR